MIMKGQIIDSLVRAIKWSLHNGPVSLIDGVDYVIVEESSEEGLLVKVQPEGGDPFRITIMIKEVA